MRNGLIFPKISKLNLNKSFSVSDFNYQLSKIHEQHATDMAHLVETFRKKTNEVQSAGPPMVNTIAIAWEQVGAGTGAELSTGLRSVR